MKTAIFAVILFGALVIWGCEKNEGDNATDVGGGPGSGLGTLVVRLSDAPGAYEAVNIVVDSIRAVSYTHLTLPTIYSV